MVGEGIEFYLIFSEVKQMSKMGESLLKGANEALSYAKGHKKVVKIHRIKIPMDINVREVRNGLHMSQNEEKL